MLQRKFRRESAASAECPFGYVFRQDVSNGVESVTAPSPQQPKSPKRADYFCEEQKRAKQGRAFRRIFPLSPPCATTPAAARCQRPPWCVVASRQGGRPQSLRGKKGREKRSSHLDFDKFRAGQQQLPGKDIAGGKSGFSRDVGLPG